MLDQIFQLIAVHLFYDTAEKLSENKKKVMAHITGLSRHYSKGKVFTEVWEHLFSAVRPHTSSRVSTAAAERMRKLNSEISTLNHGKCLQVQWDYSI